MCTRIKKLNRSAPETTDVDHHAGDRAVDRANDLVPRTTRWRRHPDGWNQWKAFATP
jgi:hypothetical protein